MKDYDDLVRRLREGTGLPVLRRLMNEAADAIEDLSSIKRAMELQNLRRRVEDQRVEINHLIAEIKAMTVIPEEVRDD